MACCMGSEVTAPGSEGTHGRDKEDLQFIKPEQGMPYLWLPWKHNTHTHTHTHTQIHPTVFYSEGRREFVKDL